MLVLSFRNVMEDTQTMGINTESLDIMIRFLMRHRERNVPEPFTI